MGEIRKSLQIWPQKVFCFWWQMNITIDADNFSIFPEGFYLSDINRAPRIRQNMRKSL